MVDLSRTILDIAGAKTGYNDDGVEINLHQKKDAIHQLARHSLSEYWVLGVDEGVYGGTVKENNSESTSYPNPVCSYLYQPIERYESTTNKTANRSLFLILSGVRARESCTT